MFAATRALRQAAAHAERQPMIKFLGPRSIPCTFQWLLLLLSGLSILYNPNLSND